MHAITSISFANYNFQLSSDANPATSFDLNYNINHYSAKTEFNYFPKEKVNIKFGLSSTLYKLQPGEKIPLGTNSLVKPIDLLNEKGVESALFGGYEYEMNERVSVYGVMRVSIFNSLGPGQTYTYLPNRPKEVEYISDTTFHGNNKNIKTYVGPELRLSGRYKLNDNLSLKFSYDRMNQYIHVL